MESKGIKLDGKIWTKPKFEKAQLFTGILKVIKDVATSDWLSVPATTLDIIGSLKHDDKPGQIGWKLISRALVDSLLNLIVENNVAFEKKEIVVENLDASLDSLLENEDFFIGIDFFKTPGKLQLIEKTKPFLTEFLTLFGFEENQVSNILDRLPNYFTFSLVNEWRKNYKYYHELKSALQTPFDDAEKRETEWAYYSKWLIKQADSPVFSETFGLRQIYIPLRAYYKKREKPIQGELTFDDTIIKRDDYRKIVVDIESELLNWIEKGNKNDAIRVVRGGPGSGKSSFFKMLAAQLALLNKKVLFIPLHRFEIRDDLTSAVQNFIKYDNFFTLDPFEEDRLIILFDGLDELTMQGSLLADVANQFLREVEKKVDNYNNRKLKVQILISGRDVIVQQNENELRKEGQILSILPYHIEEGDMSDYIDTESLLKIDQRSLWWNKYGQLKRKAYDGLPKELRNGDLDEITSQPLLNYLVALSFERGKINFSENPNLNTIYNDLLEAVYYRNYSEGKTFHSVKHFLLPGFVRMLEEIAVASWHGNGRTTTVAEIELHFKDSGIQKLLDEFIKDAEKGVVSLLAAFYFRQAGQNVSGSQTFEFTHKSFGEYLTAKRIVNKVLQINKNLAENENNFDEGWNAKRCLSEWIKIFGPKNIDYDMVKFLDNEIRIQFKDTPQKIEQSQQTIIKLINHILREGMPFEEIAPRPSYQSEWEQSINAEKALLVLLGIIANVTDTVSKIKWPNFTSFGDWISKLIGQRTGPEVFIIHFLNHLDLENCILHIRDLFRANLKKSILVGAGLDLAILRQADLKKADLRNATLYDAQLQEAELEKANLKNCTLEKANFERADLSGANLAEARLEGANLSGAKLTGADLSNSSLIGAKLTDADLTDAILVNANMKGAILTNAALEGANIEDVKLSAKKLAQILKKKK